MGLQNGQHQREGQGDEDVCEVKQYIYQQDKTEQDNRCPDIKGVSLKHGL